MKEVRLNLCSTCIVDNVYIKLILVKLGLCAKNKTNISISDFSKTFMHSKTFNKCVVCLTFLKYSCFELHNCVICVA